MNFHLTQEQYEQAVQSLVDNPLQTLTRYTNGVWQVEYKDGKRYNSYDRGLTWKEVA